MPEQFKLFGFILLLGFNHCHPQLPEKKYPLFDFGPEVSVASDSVTLRVPNPLACPLRLRLSSEVPEINLQLREMGTQVLAPHDTLVLEYALPTEHTGLNPDSLFHYNALIGNPSTAKQDTSVRYSFPFPKGRVCRILQGYNGNFSHHGLINKCAIDFKMDLGDTVCAAREGVVVSKIDQYTVGGTEKEYKSYANVVFVYHEDGTIAEYVHLEPNSALVNIGDSVHRLQPIALVGKTGLTTTPHLHFCTIIPTPGGAEGIPIKFEAVDAQKLGKGVTVRQ